MEKITVIVPCYNEEAALHYYYKEMSRVMDEMNDVDFELLLVNDGSKDKTLEIMMELAIMILELNIYLFQEILEKKQRCMQVLKTVQGIMSV